MARSLLTVLLVLVATQSVGSQDLGRTDRLWREYLSETVQRGLPLVAQDPFTGVVPFWPTITRFRAEAESLQPGADTDLVGAWIDAAEGQKAWAVSTLKASWPRPALTRWPARIWGETLFASWDPLENSQEWTDAWLAWENKAYTPRSLVRGLEALELTDSSAVLPLLKQALELYPEDRRFLPLLARHPEASAASVALIARDRARGGWAPRALQSLLDRQPTARAILLLAGYTATDLDAALSQDYGAWLASGVADLASGTWAWDAGDGRFPSTMTVDRTLSSWTKRTADGLWTLAFRDGLPESLVEYRSGASWTLRWEAYPWASTLEYRWGSHAQIYRFRPLVQAVPLWPQERFQSSLARLPAALATLWLPLDPRDLAASASSVETWEGGKRLQTLSLYRGQVWLQIEDTDGDGHDDRWSYFRGGKLASVYTDTEGQGQADLRELYQEGQLSQVQYRAAPGIRTEFVLFPREGVQLWDPHGEGRPLERRFVWNGDTLGALVFSGDRMPWETMPGWEPRP